MPIVRGYSDPFVQRLQRVYGEQVFGNARTQAGAAGVDSYLQLFNPAASGFDVALFRSVISTNTAQNITMIGMNAAIAGPQAGSPYLIGSSATGVAEARTATSGSFLGTNGIFFFHPVLANEPLFVDMEHPIIIQPGFGLGYKTNVNNTSLEVSWLYVELPRS